MTSCPGTCRWLAAALLAVVGASLSNYGHAREEIFVYAAASLTNVVGDVLDVCTLEHSEPIKVSFASSSVLAKQIDHGAPAAIFLSANAAWMNYLDERDLLLPGNRHRVAGNALVMIAPTSSPLTEHLAPAVVLAGLPTDGRVAMGDPDHVPAGIYAKAALKHIGAWWTVRERAARSATVRAALALVETGAAHLGIVYATDARVSRRVRVVAAFPPASHPPIVYEAALVRVTTLRRQAAFFPAFSASMPHESLRVTVFLCPGVASMLTPAETEALLLSLRVATWCVIATLPLGIAMAWLLARRDFYGKNLLNGALHLPLVLPPVAVGYLLLLTFGRHGPVGGWLYETFGVGVAFTWQALSSRRRSWRFR